MYSVTQITEPGRGALGVEIFDAGVIVGGGDGGAGDGDPVLGGGVLKGDLGGLVGGEVVEFGGVLVCEEEEVGAFALEASRGRVSF